jgi:hypothetical protein
MAIEVGREYRLEVHNTLAAPTTITAITKANPAVVSAAGHGIQAGDFVILKVDGMVEVDHLVVRVSATGLTAGAFELVGINSTNFGTFTTGTVERVTAWATIGATTSVDFGAGQAEEIDVTTLLDSTKRKLQGPLDLPAVTVNLFTDPSSAAQTRIDTLAYSGEVGIFRATRKSGAVRCFGGYPSTLGESVNVNQPIAGSFNVVVRSPRHMRYAS